jgi:hypothetical protein
VSSGRAAAILGTEFDRAVRAASNAAEPSAQPIYPSSLGIAKKSGRFPQRLQEKVAKRDEPFTNQLGGAAGVLSWLLSRMAALE